MTKLSFPLERIQSLKILGEFYTGRMTGRILVGALFIIGLLFMNNLGFAPISVIFFLIFILPMALILNKRMIIKGNALMGDWCDIDFDEGLLRYKTGFPNTMDPEWKEVTINKKNRDITIRGESEMYHLQLSGDRIPPIKLGLWFNLDDARAGANELQSLFNGSVTEEIRS